MKNPSRKLLSALIDKIVTNIKLALTNFGEATAVEFHKKNNSQGLKQLKEDMNKSRTVLNKSKKEIEKELERPIVTSEII